MVNFNHIFNLNHRFCEGEMSPFFGGNAHVDGRKKDDPILALANTTSGECLNPSKDCMPNALKAVVSYFAETNTKGNSKDGFKSDLKNVMSLLKCKTETCVLTHPKFVEKVVHRDNIIPMNVLSMLIDKTYKPPGDISNQPKMGGMWPSIMRNLFSFTEIYHDFSVIAIKGPNGLQRVDIHDLTFNPDVAPALLISMLDNTQKRRFGTIFNNVTDRTEGVEHAVSLFIDCRDNIDEWTVEYFNSHGTQPEKAIAEWMRKAQIILTNYRKLTGGVGGVRIVSNNIQQQGNSIECSLYAQFFLKCRLENVPYDFFKKTVIPAETMIQFRKHMFRDYKSVLPKF